VDAVWANKLLGDARNRWDAAGLVDPRVAHLWDGNDVAGGWLPANVGGDQGCGWGTYLLFGPDATWPGPASPARCAAPVARSDHQIDVDDLTQAIDGSPGATWNLVAYRRRRWASPESRWSTRSPRSEQARFRVNGVLNGAWS